MDRKAFGTYEQRSTVFLSNNDEVYRIPALFYHPEKKVLLAFAEKRRTSNDASTEDLVMKIGTLIKEELTHEISVQVIL